MRDLTGGRREEESRKPDVQIEIVWILKVENVLGFFANSQKMRVALRGAGTVVQPIFDKWRKMEV